MPDTPPPAPPELFEPAEALTSAPAARFDRTAPWWFVVNAKSGHNDPQQTRAAIEAAMSADGRRCEFLSASPEQLPQVAREAAERALAAGGALIGVGGDGTINAVAQAAYSQGCVMGFVPQGTFNYFGRLHQIPLDAHEAIRLLLRASPQPVQVGIVNDHLFLVNASVGLYPEMFEDREAWKQRFGRHRIVAIVSSIATILTRHRKLRLRIELDGEVRDVATPTLFIGNNRLQLERVGLPQAQALDHGRLAAVMARDTSTWSLIVLLLRGALGSLGDVDTVQVFSFQRMRVEQRGRLRGRRRTIKLAYDGEVIRIGQPLEFRVAERPLQLLKPTGADALAVPIA